MLALRVTTVVLAVCGAAVGIYATASGVDTEADERYREALHGLSVANTALDAALLRSRAGLDGHFDDIVRFDQTRRAHEGRLEQVPRFFGDGVASELHSSVRTIHELLAKQEPPIEQLKSDLALLRNSVRHIPRLAQQLLGELRGHPAGEAVAARLNALSTDLMLFHLDGIESRDSASANLDALDELAVDLPADIRRSLQLLRRHTDIIFDRKTSVDRLLRELAKLPLGREVDELQQAYEAHLAVALDRTQALRLVTFFLALASVVCGAAYIIVRMQRSRVALRTATVDLERALASLEVERAKQAELAEMKSRFVAMTSHEFRTPLSVIFSSAELLDAYGERWSSDKRAKHLVRIQEAASSMKRLLDGVLLIGRAEAGMLAFQPAETDVAALCDELVQGFLQDAGTSQAIELTTRGDLSACWVDASLLQHVVDNLVSNAIKYSPSDSPIWLEVCREGDELEIVVADCGIGIAPDELASLFDMFHRGNNVGDVKGTGLGLAIVKRSVDAHGGRIDVDSTPGSGTRFVVRLPLERKQA